MALTLLGASDGTSLTAAEIMARVAENTGP